MYTYTNPAGQAAAVPSARHGMEAFEAAQRAYTLILWGPLVSALDLLGLALAANPLTHALPAATFSFFQASRGQQGQGFSGGVARALTYSETNLDGAPGQLPSGYSYVAFGAGLAYHTEIPLHVKEHLDRYSNLAQVRNSFRWEMGPSRDWPCAEFGVQSKSVATTIANQFVDFATNGGVTMRKFPPEGRIYFPSKDIIRFDITIDQPVFMTTDGLTWNGVAFGGAGSNALDPTYGALIEFIMEGCRFEEGPG